MVLADFLRSQFDVPTVALRDEPGQVVDDEHDGDLGPFAVASLREDETLARLATGIKRFSLPDEFNYIKIYRSIAESDAGAWGEHTLDVLGEAFEHRRQYARAAEIWEQADRARTDVERTISAASISRRSWPTGVSSVPRASSRPARRHRSSSASAMLGPYGSKAHEVLVAKLLDDAKAYLKALRNGMKFDLDQIATVRDRLANNQVE